MYCGGSCMTGNCHGWGIVWVGIVRGKLSGGSCLGKVVSHSSRQFWLALTENCLRAFYWFLCSFKVIGPFRSNFRFLQVVRNGWQYLLNKNHKMMFLMFFVFEERRVSITKLPVLTFNQRPTLGLEWPLW